MTTAQEQRRTPRGSGEREPVPVPAEPPPGFWRRDVEHFPVPPSPAMRSLLPILSDGASELGAAFGMLVDRIELAEIGGWTYGSVFPLEAVGDPPSAEVRERLGRAECALREDLAGRMVDDWLGVQRGEFRRRIEALRADLTSLPDEQLLRSAEGAVGLLADGARTHFPLQGALMVALGELAFFCHEHLGWDDVRVFDLLVGTSATSTEPARALAAVADVARRSPSLRRMFDSDTPPDVVLASDPDFAAAVQRYCDDYGRRALCYDVSRPALAEDPGLLVRLVRDQVAGGYDPSAPDAAGLRAEEAAAAARRPLTGERLERFDRLLARARRAYPVREDNEFFAVSAPYAELRHALLEVGRRLAERGALDERDDVFQLAVPDALAALRDGRDRRDVVRLGRARTAWALAHPGPDSYGTPPSGLPDLGDLPPAARLTNGAMWWTFAQMASGPAAGNGDGSTLTGVAAAAGRYRGPVRVVLHESQFAEVQPGDVLVCTITSPVWSVLFPSVGAVVTETGGMLSHSAIIAREFGIPAVTGTGTATRALRDGQTVTVDGSSGTVRVEP